MWRTYPCSISFPLIAGVLPAAFLPVKGKVAVSLFLCVRAWVFLWQIIHVLLDRQEDSKNVCRLDQVANYADWLHARVKVDVVFSFFLFEGALLEDGGARNNWVTRFFVFVKNLQCLFVSISCRLVGLHSVVFSSSFLIQ